METNNNVIEIAKLAAAAVSVGTNDMGEDSVPFVVIPDNYSATSVEHMLPTPSRKRGIVHVNDEEGFIAVVLRHMNLDTEIYRSKSPTPSFTAIFNGHARDGGDPGWADFYANYECPMSPEWKVWSGKNKVQMRQAEFAQFIEDNLPDIKQPDAATMLEIAMRFEAKKNVKFASDKRLDNGEVQFTYIEEIEANGKGQMQVPRTFVIGIPIFENGQAYRIDARFRYRIGDGGALVLWYDLERPHIIVDDAVSELTEKIEKRTGLMTINGHFER